MGEMERPNQRFRIAAKMKAVRQIGTVQSRRDCPRYISDPGLQAAGKIVRTPLRGLSTLVVEQAMRPRISPPPHDRSELLRQTPFSLCEAGYSQYPQSHMNASRGPLHEVKCSATIPQLRRLRNRLHLNSVRAAPLSASLAGGCLVYPRLQAAGSVMVDRSDLTTRAD